MENVAPGTMRAVSRELRDLTQHPIEGVKLLMNESDLTDITAHITGPSKCNVLFLFLNFLVNVSVNDTGRLNLCVVWLITGF